MNKADAVSFWTPIVPFLTPEIATKEWFRYQSDKLFSFGRHVYLRNLNNTLEPSTNRGPTSYLEIAIKVVVFATIIIPIIALAIKTWDRMTHKYTLISDGSAPSSPELTPPSSPRPIQDEHAKKKSDVVKCQAVAERLLPKMIEMYYQPNGEIHNDLDKAEKFNNYFGTLNDPESEYYDRDWEDYPERLLKIAEEHEAEGNPEKAEACRKKAEKNALLRVKGMAKVSDTLFPVELKHFDCKKVTREDCFRACEKDFSKQTFFYVGEKQKMNPLAPVGNNMLNAGFGIPLSITEKGAQKFATLSGEASSSLLKVQIKSNLTLAQQDDKIYHLVQDVFSAMVREFLRKNTEAVRQEAANAGVEYINEFSTVYHPLLNFFTRDFYMRHGFRGVYVAQSTTLPEYVNLFYPNEDIVSIK